jgi:hypothetical protein
MLFSNATVFKEVSIVFSHDNGQNISNSFITQSRSSKVSNIIRVRFKTEHECGKLTKH